MLDSLLSGRCGGLRGAPLTGGATGLSLLWALLIMMISLRPSTKLQEINISIGKLYLEGIGRLISKHSQTVNVNIEYRITLLYTIHCYSLLHSYPSSIDIHCTMNIHNLTHTSQLTTPVLSHTERKANICPSNPTEIRILLLDKTSQ